jgi:serine/threonine protein kinase
VPAHRTDARIVAGRYELTDRLGSGGFGVVWRAYDRLLQRDVAVKEVHVPITLDEPERDALRAKILREARAAARLTHPGLVTVFDVVEEDGRPLIVMELVNAPTLAELVDQDGPLTEEGAAAIGCEILDALTVAHAEGIIHRDVKPANVMVHNTGRVQLADFGVAIIDDPSVTTSGQLAGSPSYMSPEQAQNQPVSPGTDLWGLGATLYFAVEGEPPFEKDGAIATLTSVVSDEPRPMQRAHLLAPLLGALLAKDVHERPPVEQVRRQLGDVVEPPEMEETPEPLATDPSPTMELSTHDVAPPAPPVPPVPPVPRVREPERAPEPPPPVVAVEPVPAPAPERARPRQPQRARRRSSGALVAIVAVLAVVALVAVLAATLTGQRDEGTPSASETPTTTTPGQAAPAPQEGGGGGGSGGSGATVAVPRDWVSYRDPATGFTVAHPPGWTITTNGTLTDFRDPQSGAYLRIDYRQPPGPSPEGAWFALEPSFAADYPSYQRIRIVPTTYKGYRAAIWEFTYQDGGANLHAVDLGFIAGNYGFALNFQSHAADWEAMQPTFERFKESFKAPS